MAGSCSIMISVSSNGLSSLISSFLPACEFAVVAVVAIAVVAIAVVAVDVADVNVGDA